MARRRSNRRARNAGFNQRPFAELRSPLRPTELVTTDQLETLHHASLRVLRDIGLKVDCS
ncbi:MAG: methyltransferase, partial [Rhodobacteraceae bacterium]|nr:methyltransferase [Paracoccaceae bacterium]